HNNHHHYNTMTIYSSFTMHYTARAHTFARKIILMKKYSIACLALLLAACGPAEEGHEGHNHEGHAHGHHGGAPVHEVDSTTLIYDDEKHFKNVIQLTKGGDNAEAYFSFD